MAFNAEEYTTSYDDLPLTKFPKSEDVWGRMSDVNYSLLTLAKEYNTKLESGDYAGANQLLSDNPTLANCFFNAEKYNQLRDAVIALQRYQLKQIDNLYNTIAEKAIGVTDNPEERQKSMVAYSASKVDSLLAEVKALTEGYHKRWTVKVPASGWSAYFPFTNTVTVQDVTESMDLVVIGLSVPSETNEQQAKALVKASGMLITNETGVGNGTVTFKAYKKPATDFSVIIEGGASYGQANS